MSESAEQARTRRRWITLAEFVAVAGLLIGVATLYMNWSDRRHDETEKAAAAASENKTRGLVTLSGDVRDGGATIALSDPAHPVTDATVAFPDALGVVSQDAMPGPALRRAWIEAPLRALTDKGPDDRDGRLPVLITASWWDGETKRSDAAVYQILWRTRGRMLRGREFKLAGLALVDRAGSKAALEKAWARRRTANR